MKKTDTVSLYLRTGNNTPKIVKAKIERGDSQTLKQFIQTFFFPANGRAFLTIILIYFSFVLLYILLF